MRQLGTVRILSVCTLLVFVVGCGETQGDLPKTAEVTGKVTYKDRPLASAIVMFYPDGGQKPATGRTDEDGNYSLSTFGDKDGAEIGKHIVTVTAYEQTEEGVSMKSAIPQKYGSKQESPLSTTVKEDDNRFDIVIEE